MTIVAMAIDQRRAKRKTTTMPGLTPVEAASHERANTQTGDEPESSAVDTDEETRD